MRPATAEARAARRDCWWLVATALLLRVGVAIYASRHFPPADDGTFYHAVAQRIAQGNGYTWAWPDGAISYAAHYPVGYPALLALVYAVFDAAPLSAMLLNAALGALLVLGVHATALHFTSRARARFAALSVALHPSLVLYTAALMTEAAAAAVLMLLVVLALRHAARSRSAWGSWALGPACAVLIFLRPQLLPIVLILGAISVPIAPGTRARAELLLRARGALQALALCLTLVLPWTLRNCSKMDGCVFVSANGGWNLLIGTMPEGKGGFSPIAGSSVPAECREVFGEASKDRCFGQAGARRIASEPVAWLSLMPLKLGQLFDHGSVAAPYLHASNPSLLKPQIKQGLAALETVCSRLLLLAACLGVLRASVRRIARASALLGLLAALSPWGFLAQLGLFGSLVSEPRRLWPEPLRLLALALLGLMFVTHMVFFGAARYALVWLPWLSLLAVLPVRLADLQERADKLLAISGVSESFDSSSDARG